MWRLLIRNHHLRTSHSTVRLLLRQMDPAGVEERRHHRLRRRTYFSRGPNDTWHVDGYDKLRPYGILINGYVIPFMLFQYASVYSTVVVLDCTYIIHFSALSVTYLSQSFMDYVAWIHRAVVSSIAKIVSALS